MLAIVFCFFAVAIILTYITNEARKHAHMNETNRKRNQSYIDHLNELTGQLDGIKEAQKGEEAED
jgi:preprotein translocase subunit SecG